MQDHWIFAANGATNMPNDKNLWKSNSFSLNKRLIFMLHKTTIWPKIKNFGREQKFRPAYSNMHGNVLIDFRIFFKSFSGSICDAIYETFTTQLTENMYVNIIYSCSSHSDINYNQVKRWLREQSTNGMKWNNWQWSQDNKQSHIQYSSNCKQMERTTNSRAEADKGWKLCIKMGRACTWRGGLKLANICQRKQSYLC